MSFKYRITYDDYPKYRRKKYFRKIFPSLLPLFLLLLLAIVLSKTPDREIACELLLPGNPTVTNEAFNQLSYAMSRGEGILDALDAFCETVLSNQ